MKKTTQKQIILNYLLKGKGITQRKAITNWSIIRLSGIIYNLRNEGIKIKSVRKDNKLYSGTYVEYYIDKNFIDTLMKLS